MIPLLLGEFETKEPVNRPGARFLAIHHVSRIAAGDSGGNEKETSGTLILQRRDIALVHDKICIK